MSEEKLMNRWLVVVGAILIQLALGAIYAWSVFTKPITVPMAEGGVYGFTASQAAWIFSAGLATFAIVMVLAGRMQARIGPRPIALLGGIVLGLGYILGGFFGQSFAGQLISIGIIGGAGIGLAYVVPIAVGVKWFPDKKGMVTGLAVAGFGFGATLWVKLAGEWFGGLLNVTNVFGLPGGHRRLLRKQERGDELRMGLPGLRRRRHRRPASGWPVQGCRGSGGQGRGGNRGRRGLDHPVRDRRRVLPSGRRVGPGAEATLAQTIVRRPGA